jgi:hypothetical protein
MFIPDPEFLSIPDPITTKEKGGKIFFVLPVHDLYVTVRTGAYRYGTSYNRCQAPIIRINGTGYQCCGSVTFW